MKPMKPGNMLEIRWHGRGGQGAKTAADFIASCSIKEGKYSQGFPDYGPERMGAPIRGFTRISEEPIRLHCPIDRPDIVVVLDETILDSVDVTAGLPDDGVLIVNTQDSPGDLRRKHGIEAARIYTLDATKIAFDEIGRPIPNTPMVGALVKITGILGLDGVIEVLKEEFKPKFNESIIEGNLKAVRRAYEEVRGE
ncbi:MAG: 2-oxoacid:acceptor oxidoreductase family protein [Candidatus Tritonobacter lacicola]|nr:2-oxoacid:acceptor oxidoreductase family protein [Candidatus Tritonobacter lacicola]